MDYKDLDLLTKGHPLDIARMIENADPDRQFDLLNQLPLERMNAVFIELSDELALSYIDSLPVEKKKALFNTLEMDEVRNLLEDVESAEAGEMLS